MATCFFFKDSATGVWNYGLLETVGEVTSIKSKTSTPAGTRVKLETIDGVDHVTLMSPTLSTHFLNRIAVTEVAKNADFASAACCAASSA